MAAEEGEVAVAAEGVGGAFGFLGGLAEGAAALAHRGRGCWNAGRRGGSWRGGNGGAGRGHCGRRSLRPRARHGLGAGEHALPAPAGQRGRGLARPVRQQHERSLSTSRCAPAAATKSGLEKNRNNQNTRLTLAKKKEDKTRKKSAGVLIL